jgi:hypothetical protein
MKKFILLLTSVALFNCFHSQYCVNGGPTNDEDSNVESVEIIGENNTSINYIGCPAVIGIEDQTSLYVDLNSGSSYTLDVQFGTCDDNYASVGEVWIDFNQDAIFDTSESIGSWSGTPPVSISNFTFTVPSNSLSGYSRIRVIQLEGGSLPIDPCASFQYGSVVDFTVGINTSCTSISAPFIENFDTFFPVCWVQDTTDEFDWTLNNGGTNSANTGPSDDVSGLGNYIYTEASNPRDDGDKAIVYSGSIDVSNLTSPELNFYYHMYGSAIGDLDIDLYNGNNYANIFSLSGDQGNQWIQKQILLSTGSLSLTTIKFRITVTLSSDSNGDTWPGDIAIDDFEVRESPSCPEVLYHTVNTSNSTTSSTIIDWTAGGSETAWNIEYGPLGFTQGTGTTLSFITNNPYTLNGLNSSSSYEFYIQSLCGVGNLSLWSGPYSFSTSCGAISAPYLQNFDNFFPVCWLQDSTDEFDWSLNSGPTPSNQFGTGPTDDITGGGNYIYTEASDPRDQGDEAILYTDSINISSLTNPELSFYYHMYGDDMGDLDIEIFDGTSYTNIFTLSGDQGDQWYEQNLPINSTSNVVIFRLKGTIGGDYSGDISIDNFEVREAPTCPKVLLSTINASNISSSGSEISWTAGGNETAWNIEYGPSGFAQNNGTLVSVSTNPYTVNGLSPNTDYDFYIQAYCSSTDLSFWSGPYSFTTSCALNTAPYFENFDVAFPICWVQEISDEFDWSLNSGPPPTLQNGFQTGPLDDVTGGGNYIYTEASNPRDLGDEAILFTNSIDISSLTNPELNFYYHMYGADMGDLDIELFDGTNYINIFTLSGDQGDQWFQQSLPITTSSNLITFRITGTIGDGWSSDMAIDNFEVREAPTCPAPTSLSFNNLSSTSVEISWQSSANANSWIINYNGNIINTNSNPTVVNNLTPSTNYNVFVTSICPNNDTSYNSAPITFTTSCPARIAPFIETFDTIFPICWSQEDVSDDFDWTLNDGGTNSADTGPSDDVTGGGSYMYTEASNPRDDGDFAIMYSENIDLTNLTNPMLQFYTHMYGSAIGELQIDVFDGNNYIPIFDKVGEKGDFWEEENILIDPTLSSAKFRITGILSIDSDGDTWPGDIAIDEFRVFEAIASDLELYKGYSNSGCSLSSSEQVSVIIVNKGISPQTNFSISYKINGGAPVSEIVTTTISFGDTLNYTFNTTADLSVDGVYNFEFETQVNNDQVPSNNIFTKDEENFTSPAAAITVNDTICKGEPLSLIATSTQGLINWYSDLAGMMPLNGNIVTPPPTTTTTYYAEVQGSEMYKDDFESYNFGDFIAQSSSYWTTISGNGGIQDQEDARISSSQSSSGINSVYLNEINDDNLFLLFNQDVNEGIVEINMNLRVETSANINFQNSIVPGSPEIFELRMNSGTLEFDIGTNVLTASYPGNNTWFNLKIVGDLNSLFWTIYINGVQISGANIPGANQIGLVNFSTTPGDAYYIDDVEWYVISDDDCYSSLTALTVFVEPCLSISEQISSDIQLFPNPTSGIINFTASSKIKNIEIIDFQGKIVIRKTFNSLNAEIDLEMLQKGIYFCNIITSQGSVYKKIIIQ